MIHRINRLVAPRRFQGPESFTGYPLARSDRKKGGSGGGSAPSLRATATSITTSGTTAVTLPTRVAGDVLVAITLASFATGATPTANTGWTRNRIVTNNSDLAVFTRVSDGTDNTPFSGAVPVDTSVVCYSIRNATGVDVSATNLGSNTTNMVAPSVVTTAPTFLICAYGRDTSSGTITVPGGLTQVNGLNAGSIFATGYKTVSSAGATGTQTATQTDNFTYEALTVAIK